MSINYNVTLVERVALFQGQNEHEPIVRFTYDLILQAENAADKTYYPERY